MKTPLDNLIANGKQLLSKIELHYQQDPKTLPPDQQVMVVELNGWYRGVETALEKAFGTNSHELKTWHFRQQEITEREWEEWERNKNYNFVTSRLEYALGTLAELKIATTESVDAAVASLSFDALHPKIVSRCNALLSAGNLEDAVFAAFRTIEEEVRLRSGCEPTDLGVNLISKAMNPKSPLLRFRSVDSEQESVHSLFRGAIGAFKNPLSHRSVDYPEQVRVLELLAFASLLMQMLDAADATPRQSA
ncbi:MAG: hypothetical protein QOD99_3116 [Chthoniobacter sp.]|jgi:uncharacterized protein (TIGR02391 family)|nr:hypothetical protein [Chthoniobacter sp.]